MIGYNMVVVLLCPVIAIIIGQDKRKIHVFICRKYVIFYTVAVLKNRKFRNIRLCLHVLHKKMNGKNGLLMLK